MKKVDLKILRKKPRRTRRALTEVKVNYDPGHRPFAGRQSQRILKRILELVCSADRQVAFFNHRPDFAAFRKEVASGGNVHGFPFAVN